MIRIAYISRVNLQSGRTNVYNLAKTCEAMNAQNGFSVQLVTTDQVSNIETFFQKLRITKPFPVICLAISKTTSTFAGKFWYEFVTFLSVNVVLSWFLCKKRNEFDVVYFRDESLFPAAFFSKLFFSKKVFFEIHSVYERAHRQMKNVLSAYISTGIVAISSGVKDHYKKINPSVLVSLCSAAEESWFVHSKSKKEFRTQLELPEDAFILCYAGVVGINPNNDYYEIDDVVLALSELPTNVICVIVGEINGNGERLREKARKCGVSGRVIILPWQERASIPQYLQAADAIVIPKRKKDLVGDSPAKMFPALAAHRPIIAGRADSIQEVLTDGVDSVILEENTPAGWQKAIKKVANDPVFASKISDGAAITKYKYTWDARGVAIADFIKSHM